MVNYMDNRYADMALGLLEGCLEGTDVHLENTGKEQFIVAEKDGAQASYPLRDILQDADSPMEIRARTQTAAQTLQLALRAKSLTDRDERRRFVLHNVLLTDEFPDVDGMQAEVQGRAFRFLLPANPRDTGHCRMLLTEETAGELGLTKEELVYHARINGTLTKP